MHLILNKYLLVCQLSTISVFCIWPPPYKVDLQDSEEFVIGEPPDEDKFFDDDEMIKGFDIAKFHLEKDEHKFYNLHKLVKRFNEKLKEDKYSLDNDKIKYISAENELYSYLDESESEQAGFVDENNNFIDNRNVYYLNNITKQFVAQQTKDSKRSDDTTEEEYSYDELHQEYQLKIKKLQELNQTYNASHTTEETVKSNFKNFIDFKSTPRNCTAEELTGIGIAAVKCVWLDAKTLKTTQSKMQLFYKVKRIFIIWFLIYITIAVPCWCQKGWCCCCCRFKCCRPRERINEAKKFLMDYPPGVYTTHEGNIIKYEANVYEKHAYEKLKRILMTL